MLPVKGMLSMYDRLNDKIYRQHPQVLAFSVKHRTYEMRQFFLNGGNSFGLEHYGTCILKIDTDLAGFKTVSARIYSASDRDAVNAMMQVLGLAGQYKFNIHGQNILGGNL